MLFWRTWGLPISSSSMSLILRNKRLKVSRVFWIKPIYFLLWYMTGVRLTKMTLVPLKLKVRQLSCIKLDNLVWIYRSSVQYLTKYLIWIGQKSQDIWLRKTRSTHLSQFALKTKWKDKPTFKILSSIVKAYNVNQQSGLNQTLNNSPLLLKNR